MRKPKSMRGLETFGRVRLSRYFFMRDFLCSEISVYHGIPNVPDDPDLCIHRGRAFCENLLDPLVETFGHVSVRSGFRSAHLNAYGNANDHNCARNDYPWQCHIWDRPGDHIAGASIVIPWFADQYDTGRDWRDLAWWIHDHLPYSEQWFFPKLAAFNLTWEPVPRRTISSYIAPRGKLLAAGAEPEEPQADRARRYAGFPPLRGIAMPSAREHQQGDTR